LFGPHLIIDGTKCDTTKLADRLLVERILSDYPRAIGMTRIGGPYMFEYQAPDPAYSGVSGLVVIAESHIAIHTFPALDFFTMDIFSCKNFDHEIAINYIREALGVQQMDRMLIQRGLSFRGPHHGAQGATDELVAAAAARHLGIEGITSGSIPTNDPLYPRPAQDGRMVWPAYGQTPDIGSYANGIDTTCTSDARSGARVVAANAAAAGDASLPGLSPIQPMQLNPTASTSGVIDRMGVLGSQARQLSKVLAQWETLACTPESHVVLALGPQIVADGMRDIVADLLHRNHVSALIIEGDSFLADAYESLGYRHYVDVDGHTETPVRTEAEWTAAQQQLTEIFAATSAPLTSQAATAHLGMVLSQTAPRPGILSIAAQKGIPVIVVGDAGLAEVGVTLTDNHADIALLQGLFAQNAAGVLAFGTTAVVSTFVASCNPTVNAMTVDASPFTGPSISSRVDASIALPLLATGLVQRIPQRSLIPATAYGTESLLAV